MLAATLPSNHQDPLACDWPAADGNANFSVPGLTTDTSPPIGPVGLNLFNPRSWGGGNPAVTNAITLEVTRVVLAIGVFAIGVELPSKYMQKHWRSLFFLLAPIMTYGWFVSAGEFGLLYADAALLMDYRAGRINLRLDPGLELPLVSRRGGLPYPHRPYLGCRCRGW